MNAKWCVSTLIIILALLGLGQEQTKASNQQILLKFTDVELASESAHDEVLTTITEKLHVLGIDDVEIIENDGLQVSIRYYSDVDAYSVKEFLSKENHQLSLNDEDKFPLDLPKEELPETYDLVVSDLQQQTDSGLRFKANLVLIQKQDFNIFSNSPILDFNHTLEFTQDAIANVSFKINRNIAIAIDNTSQTIPEVRAGPYMYGNS